MPQTVSVRIVPRCLTRPWRGRVALLAGLALSLGMSLGAQAATTWTVCPSGCNYSRIKAAIAAPTTTDGDTLAIAAGIYTEPGIVVDKSLILQGEDADTTIVQTATTLGTATGRVFTIPSGVRVTLQALMIRYGWTASSAYPGNRGGGLFNAGTLTLTHSTIRDNATGGYGREDRSCGGGLYNEGTLTLTHSTVRGNAATYSGGGLFNDDRLTLTTSIVAKNPDGGDCSDADEKITSRGYNVDSDGSCSLTAPTDQPNTDPLLGPLQDHGCACRGSRSDQDWPSGTPIFRHISRHRGTSPGPLVFRIAP
jgi:hypothetical protein